jgi:16S rRNA (cytosine1402-N4)-methyltransferase
MHVPVLSNEILEALNLKQGDTVVDATVNTGGHSKKICDQLGEKGILIGIDLDSSSLLKAEENLDSAKCRVFLQQGNFRNIDSILEVAGIHEANSVLFDLGMSSNQLLESGRGFSFQKDEPILMTFKDDPSDEELTAKEIVNNWDEENIADIIYGYGEERFARRIARAIVESRKKKKVERTTDLVTIIESAVPKWYRSKKIHCATRTFQALRIAVNDEISALREGLDKAFKALAGGGRIAVITFHSIEDRVVKKFFINLSREGKGMVVTKKPIVPTSEEVEKNPRARSAKLRVFQKTSSSAV